MTREEFEDWLEEHQPEALDRIDTDSLSLDSWVKVLTRIFKNMVEEESSDDDEVEEYDEPYDELEEP